MHRRAALLTILALAIALVIAGCGGSDSTSASKPFQPEITLHAVGGTSRTDKPAFVLAVKARPGDANLRSVTFVLPQVALVDPTAIRRLCSRSELESDRCADRQALGVARVKSPAYDEPLTGNVYAVSGGSRLPKLVFVLGGPVDLLLEGKIESEGGRIGAGVEDIPDTALSSFAFTIKGGKSGYLILSRDICNGDPEADATFESQEGQVLHRKVPLEAEC